MITHIKIVDQNINHLWWSAILYCQYILVWNSRSKLWMTDILVGYFWVGYHHPRCWITLPHIYIYIYMCVCVCDDDDHQLKNDQQKCQPFHNFSQSFGTKIYWQYDSCSIRNRQRGWCDCRGMLNRLTPLAFMHYFSQNMRTNRGLSSSVEFGIGNTIT
jgi:hypothetical protein